MAVGKAELARASTMQGVSDGNELRSPGAVAAGFGGAAGFGPLLRSGSRPADRESDPGARAGSPGTPRGRSPAAGPVASTAWAHLVGSSDRQQRLQYFRQPDAWRLCRLGVRAAQHQQCGPAGVLGGTHRPGDPAGGNPAQSPRKPSGPASGPGQRTSVALARHSAAAAGAAAGTDAAGHHRRSGTQHQ